MFLPGCQNLPQLLLPFCEFYTLALTGDLMFFVLAQSVFCS